MFTLDQCAVAHVMYIFKKEIVCCGYPETIFVHLIGIEKVR